MCVSRNSCISLPPFPSSRVMKFFIFMYFFNVYDEIRLLDFEIQMIAQDLFERMKNMKWILFCLIFFVILFFLWILSPLIIREDQKWVFYDRTGKILFSEKMSFQETTESSFDEIKRVLIAVEDKRFYEHSGVDLIAVFRAFWLNLNSDAIVSGASTITMQLSRILFLQNEPHDFWYKFRQVLYAWKLEWLYSKEEILKMYLNRVYFGQNVTGISAAAKRYFSKIPEALTFGEIATLVGIIPRPDTWNPLSDFAKSQERKNIVLARLNKQDLITSEDLQFFSENVIILKPFFEDQIHAPHFVLWAKEKLKSYIPADVSLVQVYTTIDKIKYQKILNLTRENLENYKTKNISNVSVVGISLPKNELRIMLGSVDFFEKDIAGAVNMSTSLRELGSTLKPFLFAFALDNGFSPVDELEDERDSYLTERGSYSPRNFDPHREYGRVRFREALAGSYNIAAVNLLHRVGVGIFHDFLQSLGLSLHQSSGNIGLSLILGTGESSLLDLTQAYSIFPQKGDLKPIKYFSHVIDEKGEIVLEWEYLVSKDDEIITSSSAEWIMHVLSDKESRWQNFSRGNPLEMEFEVGAKTGTSQDFRDNYVVGFSSDYVTGVWVGNADGTPMHTSSGIDGAGPVWQGVMRVLHDYFPQDFVYNSERKDVQICKLPWENYPECGEITTEFLTVSEIEKLQKNDDYQSPKLEIAFPGDGDKFHKDSSILIKVRNAVDEENVKFYLDGKPIDPIISSMKPGVHQISVENNGEKNEIEILVEN